MADMHMNIPPNSIILQSQSHKSSQFYSEWRAIQCQSTLQQPPGAQSCAVVRRRGIRLGVSDKPRFEKNSSGYARIFRQSATAKQ
jgi:hypothetical protein